MITWFNGLSIQAAEAILLTCCGCRRWAGDVAAGRPYVDLESLNAASDNAWRAATQAEVREAISHHPQIGADMDRLREKFAATADWSAGEQAGIAQADDTTLTALRDANVAYADRFGYIFLVCATGKSAAQMLNLLQARLPNDPDEEWQIARTEQGKITRIRLEKLRPMKSPLTTHVLDTANGRPAAGLAVRLERRDEDDGFVPLASGVTNADGRITDLCVPALFEAGVYRLTFDTGAWYAVRGERTFYPEASIVFEVTTPSEHHHVPLLLSPFGYSTYRGS